MTRFINNFYKLPVEIQGMIALENDDKVFMIEDVLKLCEKLNIPCVLDYHHYICNHDEELEPLLPRIIATWNGKIPKMHFSSPKSQKEKRTHHFYIDYNSFLKFINLLKKFNIDIDIMLESKGKDEALFKLLRQLKFYKVCKFIKNDIIFD